MKTSINGRGFARDEGELRGAHLGIKLAVCPYCGKTGTLTGHGWLRGYAERAQTRVIRGRRFFCSNRFLRPGCGRTFSVLLETVLAGFVVRALTLFRFLEQVALGHTRKASWLSVAAGAFSLSSGYRLWRRLRDAQSSLRPRLFRRSLPPDCSHSEPVVALFEHFRAAFPNALCPFSELQSHSQRDLLA